MSSVDETLLHERRISSKFIEKLNLLHRFERYISGSKIFGEVDAQHSRRPIGAQSSEINDVIHDLVKGVE